MLKVSITSKGAQYAYKVAARTHSFDIDAETTHKGGDTAINPHEAALGGLGGCTVMTMAMYAAQKGWSVTFELTEVTEDKIDDPADTSEGTKKKIPHIVERITVKGATDEQLAKLKDIGKRCPVYLLMVNPKVIDLEVEHAV